MGCKSQRKWKEKTDKYADFKDERQADILRKRTKQSFHCQTAVFNHQEPVIFLTKYDSSSKIVAFACSLWENENDPFLKNIAK